MRIKEGLLQLLADGAVHSGADLARTLNCSRTAVWKQLHGLRSVGLEVVTARGRGYRLERPLELLDPRAIIGALNAEVGVESLDVYSITDSTSERLRPMSAPAPGRIRAALAEYQSGGRGRRGRPWLSPFGSGLCLSVSWGFTVVPPALPALSLATGVAVNRALSPLRPSGLGLKWPNDIVAGGGKLGGILVDVHGESGGPITVVIGVGINIDVPEQLRCQLSREDGLPPAGLREAGCGDELSRNALAASMIEELQAMLMEFGRSGFAGFTDEWRTFDYLRGRQVTVSAGANTYTGTAVGIGADGALLLDENGKLRTVISGEVTLRPS